MIVIIGAGITGLSLAYFLNLKGYEVTVVEKEAQLGGNASWIELGDFTVDKFYHVFSDKDIYFLNFIQELGLRSNLFTVRTRMGFYQKGGLYPVSSTKEFLFFPALSFAERMRLGLSIIRSKSIKDWKDLDGVTASSWLSRLGGEGLYKKLWQPIMKSKFGTATEEIVATDMWFRINRISDVRNKKFKKSAYYIRGGLKIFFDTLEQRLKDRGVAILKGTGVTKIKTSKGQIESVIMNNRKEIPCLKAISTIPLPDFISLLPEANKEYAKNLRQIKYLNNICLILGLKEQFSPYYQLNLGDNEFPFTGIIGADIFYPPSDFNGTYILYISKYFAEEDNFFLLNELQLLEYYTPYLTKINPRFRKDWVLNIALTRQRNVEAMHTLNYSQLIPFFETPVKNLYLLCAAQIYPEPTVLDASMKYANMLVDKFFS